MNETRRKRTLLNVILDKGLLQNDLTEELKTKNNNIEINLAATLGVVENKPPHKERSENRSPKVRTAIWEELYNQVTEDKFVEKMIIKPATFNKVLEVQWLCKSCAAPNITRYRRLGGT